MGGWKMWNMYEQSTIIVTDSDDCIVKRFQQLVSSVQSQIPVGEQQVWSGLPFVRIEIETEILKNKIFNLKLGF